jgi:predicted membrane protein
MIYSLIIFLLFQFMILFVVRNIVLPVILSYADQLIHRHQEMMNQKNKGY